MKMDGLLTMNYLMTNKFCTLVHYYGHLHE